MEKGFTLNSFEDLSTLVNGSGSANPTSGQKDQKKFNGPRNAARVRSLSNESLDDLMHEVNQYLATKGMYALSQPVFTSLQEGKTVFHAILRFSGKIDQFQKEPWQLSTDYRYAEFYSENGYRLSEEARRWEYLLEHYESDNLADLEVDFPDSICRHHVKYGRYDDVKPTNY